MIKTIKYAFITMVFTGYSQNLEIVFAENFDGLEVDDSILTKECIIDCLKIVKL